MTRGCLACNKHVLTGPALLVFRGDILPSGDFRVSEPVGFLCTDCATEDGRLPVIQKMQKEIDTGMTQEDYAGAEREWAEVKAGLEKEIADLNELLEKAPAEIGPQDFPVIVHL
ncbi:MAG: hypothetical protein V1846_05250 [Candidatus Komeilibacteria bacterium]